MLVKVFIHTQQCSVNVFQIIIPYRGKLDSPEPFRFWPWNLKAGGNLQ